MIPPILPNTALKKTKKDNMGFILDKATVLDESKIKGGSFWIVSNVQRVGQDKPSLRSGIHW